MKIETSAPPVAGLHAAQSASGQWRILQYQAGMWWHPGLVAKWPEGAAIVAHVGPLPVPESAYTRPPLSYQNAPRPAETEDWEEQFPDAPTPAGMEFDL